MNGLVLAFTIIQLLAGIFLIVVVLLQSGKSSGLSGAVAGGAETFFGKNTSNSAEGKLKRITKILAVVFIVLAIVATIVTSRITGKDVEPAVTAEPTETVEPADAEATEEPAADATEAPAEEATEAPAEEATEAPAEEATAEPEATPAA